MTLLPKNSTNRHLKSDKETTTRRVCTACEEHKSPTSRCHAEFVCAVCGHTYNKCSSLPGGLDSLETECNNCRIKREFLEDRQVQIMLLSLDES
jgi:hypothetical protein